jgi:hypothetical protein
MSYNMMIGYEDRFIIEHFPLRQSMILTISFFLLATVRSFEIVANRQNQSYCHLNQLSTRWKFGNVALRDLTLENLLFTGFSTSLFFVLQIFHYAKIVHFLDPLLQALSTFYI